MKKDFLIENIDPLGQGVSKQNDEIIFIKKTLPGEVGIAEITASRKGIFFANADSITNKSPLRITPECSHFAKCNGCDFLHTKYENEIEFKKINIERSLGFLGCNKMQFHKAPKRFEYRNRIQLHYNKKNKALGFIGENRKIYKVDSCIIGTKPIQQKLKELYVNDMWLGLVQREKLEGHIELYEKNNKVEVHVNQSYAQGGFTQVNAAMNQKLYEFLTEKVKTMVKPSEVVFDLFGGNGNLTKGIENPTLVVDYYTQLPNNTFHQIFFHQDLYGEKAIEHIARFYSKKPSMIIFDPPRSGLKNIGEFVTKFQPEKFIFVACDFSSFTRDCKPMLENYLLDEVHIFDLFPGTHHFETVGIFTKRS